MLTISDVSFSYRHKNILDHIGLTVEPGDCVGIVGANGCGKSTFLSVIAGARKAKSGTILFDGHPLPANPAKRLALIGYVPQENPLIPELSVRDNLLIWYTGKKNTFYRELETGFLKELGLTEFLSVPVQKLSGGMKKRVSLGIALQNRPVLIVLDEPSAALDLVCKDDIHRYLSLYLAGGGTVIITSHEESELSLCNRMYLLKHGMLHQVNPQLRGQNLIQLIKA